MTLVKKMLNYIQFPHIVFMVLINPILNLQRVLKINEVQDFPFAGCRMQFRWLISG
jgi:hypothetical protein